MRTAIITPVFLVLLPAALGEDLPDPRKPGPYPVGVTTTVLVDHSRNDSLTKGPRTLLTEIWYPANDDVRDLPKNRMTDFLLRGQVAALSGAFQLGFQVKMDQIDKTFQNLAVRDARIRDGKFPLIVFSHGNGGVRFQSTFWCDHVASHGYIVMSCDHTGNAAATVVGGRVVLRDGKGREQAALDRPKDVSFLISSMARMAKGEDSRFAGRVDLNNVAVAGHSFGGFTAGAVINTDDRVKAIIPMTPVFGERKKDTVPLLMFLGAEDATIGVAGNERALKYFQETRAPKWLVDIKDAGHFSFSDMGQFRPDFGDGIGKGKRVTKPDEPLEYLDLPTTFEITNSYSTAFLGVFLKDQKSYREFLDKDQFPGKIRFESVPEPTATASK